MAWIVQEFRDRDQFELSVVKAGSHGTRSWGWPSSEKIIFFAGYRNEIGRPMYDMVKRYAHMMCNELNT